MVRDIKIGTLDRVKAYMTEHPEANKYKIYRDLKLNYDTIAACFDRINAEKQANENKQ